MQKPSKKSKKHHWWPVGLQSYWANGDGDVSWIEPDGRIGKKRFKNRQIGQKRHGHTLMRNGGVWEASFEDFFQSDNDAKRVVDSLLTLEPPEPPPFLFYKALDFVGSLNGCSSEPSRQYNLSDAEQRKIILLLSSLLMRAPAYRDRFSRIPMRFDLPCNEGVGTANLYFQYRNAKDRIASGLLPLVHFVGIHSRGSNFIVGDGYLDWATHGFGDGYFRGCALVPLTPKFCVFMRFLSRKSNRDPDLSAISASSAVVNEINEITQIYSKSKLFYLGKPPKLSEHFRQNEFLQHSEFSLPLVDELDRIAGHEVRPIGFPFG
jgi:hypothetical protein